MTYVYMDPRATYITVLLLALASSAAWAAERPASNETALMAARPASSRAGAVLNSAAMNAMLRADRDKDGVLSREELDEYDFALGRRFAEADVDRNGRLTLPEFETLFNTPESASVGATR